MPFSHLNRLNDMIYYIYSKNNSIKEILTYNSTTFGIRRIQVIFYASLNFNEHNEYNL